MAVRVDGVSEPRVGDRVRDAAVEAAPVVGGVDRDEDPPVQAVLVPARLADGARRRGRRGVGLLGAAVPGAVRSGTPAPRHHRAVRGPGERVEHGGRERGERRQLRVRRARERGKLSERRVQDRVHVRRRRGRAQRRGGAESEPPPHPLRAPIEEESGDSGRRAVHADDALDEGGHRRSVSREERLAKKSVTRCDVANVGGHALSLHA